MLLLIINKDCFNPFHIYSKLGCSHQLFHARGGSNDYARHTISLLPSAYWLLKSVLSLLAIYIIMSPTTVTITDSCNWEDHASCMKQPCNICALFVAFNFFPRTSYLAAGMSSSTHATNLPSPIVWQWLLLIAEETLLKLIKTTSNWLKPYHISLADLGPQWWPEQRSTRARTEGRSLQQVGIQLRQYYAVL